MTVTSELEKHRHSMAHILAQAVMRLYPDTKIGIGPVVDNGFYYEFETEKQIKEKDLPQIEREMQNIIESDYPIRQIFLSQDEASNLLLHQGQIYKSEILNEIDEEEISFYKTGEEFFDLCSGPHIESTSEAGFFKLTRIEEGHWRNKPSRPKMQKIFGVGFLTKKDLMNYIEKHEQLKQLDHRKLGQKLGFYSLTEDTGAGLPIWLPKGTRLKNIIIDYLTNEKADLDFKEVSTPVVLPTSSDLWNVIEPTIQKQIFPEVKDQDDRYYLRPDKKPLHYHIFKNKTRSYKKLPYRISEIGPVYRKENEHELHGLAKTRVFTAETNHAFVTEEQVFQEVITHFNLASKVLSKLGFNDYKVQLATAPENKDKRFQWANEILVRVINTLKLTTRQVEDENPINGPKIELIIKDIFGKEWQLGTIQLDIFSTTKQELAYVDKNGQLREVIVIKSSIIGSLERIIGLLIERTGGDLPLFLAPEQVRIIPVSEKYNFYAEKVKDSLNKQGLRVDIDDQNETLQYRIKEAQTDKVPYMLILGSKEESNNSVSVRPREGKDMGLMKLDEFLDILNKER